jgi:hypothetical protein
MKNTKQILKHLLLLTIASIAACSKPYEPKTIKYYAEHIGEAKLLIDKCVPEREKIVGYANTPQGLDCNNAIQAYQSDQWDQYQKKLQESVNKFKRPYVAPK